MPLPFQNLTHKQWLKLFELFLTLTIICLTSGLFILAVFNHWNNDFVHLWLGGYTLLHGVDPYVHLLSIGNLHANESNFINLPWVGLCFVPYALLPFDIATTVWIVTNIIFLCGSLFLTQKILNTLLPTWGIRFIQLGMLFLSVRTLHAAQITIILTFLGLSGIYNLLHQDFGRAGFWLGLTILKPTISFGLVAAAIFASNPINRNKLLLYIGAVGVFILVTATIFWPSWVFTYSQVDFRQAMGILENGEFIHYWPVATITDFAHFILGFQITKPYEYILKFIPLVFAFGLIGFAWHQFKRGALEFLELCAIGALLPALVSPYIRFYDYIFLSIWLIGFFGGTNFRHLDRKWKILNAGLVFLTFIMLPGSHPEPWVYIMPVSFSLLSIIVIYVGANRFHYLKYMNPDPL